MRRVLLAALIGSVACSVSRDSGSRDLVDQQPIDPRVLARERYGELDAPEQVAMFSRIVDAAVTPQHVVALDRSAPFVHIFDRGTGRGLAFGRDGEGPGEIRRAYGLEVYGDSAIAVLKDGRTVSRYTVAGEWLGQQRMPETHGISPMAITTGCGGRWYLYGARPDYRVRRGSTWLYEVDLEHPEATRALEIEGEGSLPTGRLEGLDASDEGVLVWHQTRNSAGWWFSCSGTPELLTGGWLSGRNIDVRGQLIEAVATSQGAVLTLPDTMFRGAALGSFPLFAFNLLIEETTVLEALEDQGCSTVTLAGTWVLHDAHEDEILIGTSYPFPELLVLRWSDLAQRAEVCPV